MLMLGQILGLPRDDLDWLVEKGDALIGNSDPDFTDFVIDKIDSDAYRFMPFRSPAGADLYDYADKVISGETKVSSEGVLARVLGSAEPGMSAADFKNFFCLLIAAGTTRPAIDRDEPVSPGPRSGAAGPACRRSVLGDRGGRVHSPRLADHAFPPYRHLRYRAWRSGHKQG